MTSEQPMDDRCGAKCRDGGFCTQYPVGGRKRCRMHGGTTDNRGEKNGNFKHGAYSKYFKRDLTDEDKEAYDALDSQLADEDMTRRVSVAREAAIEAYLKYKRSGDVRFLREFRHLCSEFNIIDATDVVEHTGEGGIVVFTEADDGDD